MSVGLDLGTHQLRSLRQDGDRLLARRCRSIYSVLPDAEPRRRRLDALGIPYAVSKPHLLVWGDAAEELAQLVPMRAIPLLPEGTVPRHNPPARQLLATLIGALLGEPRRPNETCCLTHPGNIGRSRAAFQDGVEFLIRLIRLQGYTPLVVSPGLAVVLAELVSRSFTGVGMTFGASTCEVSLAHQGREIARCTVPFGGNRIDEQLSAISNGLEVAEARRQRETFSGSLIPSKVQTPESGAEINAGPEPSVLESRLSILYQALISDVLHYAARDLSSVPAVSTVPQPMTLVVAGGTARIAGFDELLKQLLPSTPFPVQIGEVRLAVESDYTVARGCLISAALEAHMQAVNRPAA